MKRDVDLLRRLLLEIEAAAGPFSRPMTVPGRSRDEVFHHLKLLEDEGYLEGIDLSSHSGRAFAPLRLTFEGHQFLDSIRDDSVWTKTKDRAGKTLTSVSLSTLKALALGYLRQKLGLE